MSAASLAFPRQPATKPMGWVNHIPRAFLRSGVNPRLGWFLLLLDDFAGDRPFGLTTNSALRELLDCSEDTVARLWKLAEQEGWLRRVPLRDHHGRVAGRIGFIWLRRPTGLPTAGPRTWDQAVEAMRAAIDREKAHPRSVPFRPDRSRDGCKNAATPTAKMRMHPPQKCGGPFSKAEGECKSKVTTTRA
jgi:hypothetical protein